MARDFSALVQRKIDEIDGELQKRRRIGYPLKIDGELVLFKEREQETLQLRDVSDETRWLTILGICDEAVLGGFGALPLGAPLRCTSNRGYDVTLAQAGVTLRDLRSWIIAAQLNWTRLKDRVRDCATRREIELLDIEEGWP